MPRAATNGEPEGCGEGIHQVPREVLRPQTRQLPLAQVKAFGRRRSALAKTDRIDAELIARFIKGKD